MLVQIIAAQSVAYNVNGIGPPVIYDPGVIYDVPDHVARGLMEPVRQWAKIPSQEEVDKFLASQTPEERQSSPTADPPVEARSVDRPPEQPTEPPKDEHPASPAGRRKKG